MVRIGEPAVCCVHDVHVVAMTELLVRRDLLPTRGDHRAMAEAGGLWAVPHWIQRWDLIRQRPNMLEEARRRGVRALEVDRVDEAVLDAVPDLEFLRDSGVSPGHLIQRFKRLRLLGLDTWEGELDLRQLPELEWLFIGECEPGQLDSLADGHPKLRHLTVGKYPAADLAPLSRLRLERLSLGNSRRLASLANPGGLADTLIGLELWMLPALASLDGIEAFGRLEALTLSSLRQMTSLEPLPHLPRLRLLDFLELKQVDSLAPLTGHPSLEWVLAGRTADLDLSPLRTLPRLRFYKTQPARWTGDVSGVREGVGLNWKHPEYAEMLAVKEG